MKVTMGEPQANFTTWKWKWTDLCGYRESIAPLNPDTHDLGVCFQQLCFQVPVLALLAIISAYYCGKRSFSSSRESGSHYALNLRLIFTACLAILPIIRAYIILTNTSAVPLPFSDNFISDPTNAPTVPRNIGNNSVDGIHISEDPRLSLTSDTLVLHSPDTNTNANETMFRVPNRKIFLKYNDKTTSAKPVDYLVAGTEGLAWVVHFCFILSLRRGGRSNPRGPVLIRALIFLLIGVSVLLLRSHINHVSYGDVLPNLSLGFSITVVTFLLLYTLTLIPGHGAFTRRRDSSHHSEIGERTALLNSPSSSYIRFLEEQDPAYLGIAMEDATVTSKLLFHWVTPLMQKGVNGQLNHTDDLFDLPEHVNTAFINHELDKHVRHANKLQRNGTTLSAIEELPEPDEVTLTNQMSLLRLLHICFGWQFYAVGILKFVADCSGFMGPILLNKLISFVEDKNLPLSYGYLYAVMMFLTSLIGAFCNAHFTFWMSIVGLKIRAAIVSLVYRKTLHQTSPKLNQAFSSGEMMNFMTTDCDRVVNSCPSFHTFWSIPLQLVVTLLLLYDQVGIAFLPGIGFAIILIRVNKSIANKIGDLSTKMMEYKDKRVRLVGEILRGIITIKLNVWEEHFLRNVFKLRDREIKYLSGRKYLDALCVYFWATTPIIISILTFATYVLLGNKLDAKTVFTSMALLNMLIGPLNAFPWVLNGLMEAWVSVKRIQKLLNLSDVDECSYYSDPPIGVDIMLRNPILTLTTEKNEEAGQTPESEILVNPSVSSERKTVTFKENGTFTLQNINLTVQKGQLVGIMGEVGSGKSMLLDSIMAELTKNSGIVAVSDIEKGFGVVTQKPWLQRGTIRDNILFGKAYDHNKYKTILKACALTEDLSALPKKDLTGVSEGGNTLSGGQKTRVALARAVYADKDIYLLDDILATLDAKVAKRVFQNVILDLLKYKTRILCTHQTRFLIQADLVIQMTDGQIVNQGKPSDVLPDLDDFLLSSDSLELDAGLIPPQSPAKEAAKHYRADYGDGDKDSLLNEEISEKGTVRFGVYSQYLKSVGRYLTVSIFLAMILMQISKNFTDLWLSYWVTQLTNATNSTNSSLHSYGAKLELIFEDPDDTGNVKYYLTIYGVLALSNSVFTLIRAFLFAFGGIQAAIFIHKQLLKIIIKARMSFFDMQPFGRILNRFSSDTYTVDDSLPFIANILLAQLFGLVATVIVTTYGLPWVFLILAPLVPVYHWIQNNYRLTSRELKRLSSTALSPLYIHFNETLQGLKSIRAFRAIPRFIHENDLYLDASQKTQFASIAAGQWLGLRLQFIGVILLAGVCIMAVLQHQYDIVDPGLIGLAITYTLSVSGLLSGVVNAFTETEREMVAVERIKQYLENVTVESGAGDNPPYAWPTQGVVEYRQVVLKYRDYLTPSLKRVSFSTRPAEKIGIVGRTGAGKSSILASLFRLVEISSGEILIDNVNIKTLQLSALRSRLAIIPQNPFIFSGTVRENVDPLNQYPDLQVYKALEKCQVHNLVYRLGGLGSTLEEGGSNLSAGQRQLFCLVRAVLHNARILCIDEATANVDQDTERAIQTTIKSSFRSATVITIAHRIRTIMHCDRVLVMGDGEVLEFDEPNLLIENTDSYFYDLASQEFSDKE